MLVLGIETSTLTGSVALMVNGELKGENTLSVSVQHSERLLPAIDDLLRATQIDSHQLDLIGVAHGPGSFTGLRIGSAVAQGLGASLQKPVVGVSTLKVLAMNAFGFGGVIVPVLNAFRGEIYWAGYRTQGKTLEPVWPESAVPPEKAVQKLKEISEPIFILGNGASFLPHLTSIDAPAPMAIPRASYVGWLAQEKFSESPDSASFLPQYYRGV